MRKVSSLVNQFSSWFDNYNIFILFYYEELHSFYRSPNIVRVIKFRRLRWAGHVARMEEGSSAFKILTGKPTGKRPLGGPSHRWKDNIRMDLKEVDINTKNWVDSAQNRDYWRPCDCGIEPPWSYYYYYYYWT